MNGAAFKAGWAKGGREGARAELAELWGAAGALTDPAWAAWLKALAPGTGVLAELLEASPGWQAFNAATQTFSPYVTGPFVWNPLERLIEVLDFAAVQSQGGPELHVCATNVWTGKIRIFTGAEITAQALLASACLPTLFRAVEIEDPATGRTEAFWDGGYAGNPALFPLFSSHLRDDILIVSINPFIREELPRDALDIANRVNEISFNSSLLHELRAVAFVRRLIAGGQVQRGAMKDVLVHMVGDDRLMNDLNIATKTMPVPVILARLRAAGPRGDGRFPKGAQERPGAARDGGPGGDAGLSYSAACAGSMGGRSSSMILTAAPSPG
jgi:NTE family protein